MAPGGSVWQKNINAIMDPMMKKYSETKKFYEEHKDKLGDFSGKVQLIQPDMSW